MSPHLTLIYKAISIFKFLKKHTPSTYPVSILLTARSQNQLSERRGVIFKSAKGISG
jgi:hypothetical protein